MKEIKRTKTIEEVTGYEAEDGKVFQTEEECKKYEATAKGVIFDRFKQLMIGEPFSECALWEHFGYGGEEFMLAIIDIKNEDDLNAVNMFRKAYGFGDDNVGTEFIGQKVLVNLGYCGSYGDCWLYPRTMLKLMEQFTDDLDKFFNPKEKEEK